MRTEKEIRDNLKEHQNVVDMLSKYNASFSFGYAWQDGYIAGLRYALNELPDGKSHWLKKELK